MVETGVDEEVSHIIVSDCEDIEDNGYSEPGEPVFLTQKSTSAGSSARSSARSTDSIDESSELISAVLANDYAKVDALTLNSSFIEPGPLHHAAGMNLWPIAELLLKRNADPNAIIEPQMATPLLWACSNGHAYLVRLLLAKGGRIDVVDSNGFTPLHLAVHSSNILMVTYIIHLEVDVNKADCGQRTALHWAVVQGDHLSVEALLKAGASPNTKDGEGNFPLFHAVESAKSSTIVTLLLQFGADVSLASQQIDFKSQVWKTGCMDAGRLVSGAHLRSYWMSSELAKATTYLFPSFVLPCAFLMPSTFGWLLGIPAALLVLYLAKRTLESCIVPYGWPGKRGILRSTLLVGILSATLLWDVFFWAHRTAYISLQQSPISTFVLILTLFIVLWAFATTYALDPGVIEPRSTAYRLRTMDDLMDRGIFDSVHLCVHTYVQIPARARYDAYLERVVCRYDHYCPWMYNAIGVRNHRPFIIFLISLLLLIILAGYQCFITNSFADSKFGVCLALFTAFQGAWLAVLTLVQLVQIGRGVTSHELSTGADTLELHRTDPVKAYSSLPHDHPRASAVLGTSSASILRRQAGNSKCGKKKSNALLKLMGITQCLLVWRSKRGFTGSTQNCTDFWCNGENLWRPRGGGGKIKGMQVDYYTLQEMP